MARVLRGSLEGRPVAVKLLDPRYAQRPSVRQRFLVAASVMSRLDHPSIIQVHRILAQPNALGAVLDLVLGPSMETVLRTERPGPAEVAFAEQLLAPVISAVAHLHDKGLVHRDLKPENVLLSRGRGEAWPGLPRIIDFDLVQAPEAAELVQPRAGVRMGTIPYMAPEQYAGAATVTPATDVHALCMMLWQVLAGRLPIRDFDANGDAVRSLYDGSQPVPPLLSVAPHVPHPVARVVDAGLSRDPAHRPPDAGALLDQLGWTARVQSTLAPAPATTLYTASLPTVFEATRPLQQAAVADSTRETPATRAARRAAQTRQALGWTALSVGLFLIAAGLFA